jgi:hypothetical protein
MFYEQHRDAASVAYGDNLASKRVDLFVIETGGRFV